MSESVKSTGDLKEILADTRSFHLEAKLGEEDFVKELFLEIKGLRSKPPVEQRL